MGGFVLPASGTGSALTGGVYAAVPAVITSYCEPGHLVEQTGNPPANERGPPMPAGRLAAMRAAVWSPASIPAGKTVTVQLRKNGVNVASGSLTFTNADAVGGVKTCSPAVVFAAGDKLTVALSHDNGADVTPILTWSLAYIPS